MNLLDKKRSMGVMVMALLLLISCEKSGEFVLGDIDISPVDFFSEDVAVTSAVVLIDSIPSDTQSNVMVGTIVNDRFGNTRARGYVKVNLNLENLVDILDDAILDSAHFNFKFNYIQNQDFNIIDLVVGQVLVNEIHDTVSYYTDSEPPRVFSDIFTGKEVALGRARFEVTDLDSIYSMDIDDTWVNQFFEDLRNKDERLDGQESFETQYLGGLAFVPGDFNTGAFGIEMVEESDMILYFHQTSPTGTGIINFTQKLSYHDAKYLFNMEHDKVGSELEEVVETSTAYEPSSGLRYIQEGNGIVTKLDISDFMNFVEAKPNVIINFADLTIGPIEPPVVFGDAPPETILLYITDDQNTLIVDGNSFRGIQKDAGDTPSVISSSFTVSLDYDIATRSYKGSITSFIQSYHAGIFKRDQILLFTEKMNSSINGIAIKPENLQLKIFYSELK